ncbi:MAG: hypothetical protein ACK5JF_05315 [Oscillospiraceae bacterium]
MRKAPETDMEFFKEGLAEEICRREPFARAIALYLGSLDRKHYSSILNELDTIISHDIENMIREEKDRVEAAKV